MSPQEGTRIQALIPSVSSASMQQQEDLRLQDESILHDHSNRDSHVLRRQQSILLPKDWRTDDGNDSQKNESATPYNMKKMRVSINLVRAEYKPQPKQGTCHGSLTKM